MRFAIVALLFAFPVHAAEKKLAVHEWGIFRVHEDEAMANADMRQIWDGLPPFVYGHLRGRVVPQHWGAVEFRDRPIIYFHASEPMPVSVTLDFPGGMPGVWWPGTSEPAVYGNLKQPLVGKVLKWDLHLQKPRADWQPKPMPAVEKGHWFGRLREVKSDEIFSRFGPTGQYVERDRLIYYDGLFPQRKWVKFDVVKDDVTLTNRVAHAVFDVTIVDRRSDDTLRIARIAKLDEGAKVKAEFAAIPSSRFVSEAADTLAKQLTATGLNAGEAQALVDLSKQEFFDTPGLHAFYRIPQDEYDRLLPLAVIPKPDSLVRTGLVFHSHLEGDFAERILELVKQLDAPRFTVRDAARKKLQQIGPAAMVPLLKLKKTDLSTEVWKQVEDLLRQWNAKAAFE